MAGINRGETAIISIEVRNAAGDLADPATSMTITITNPSGVEVISAVAMSKATPPVTGEYHYDYAVAAAAPLGLWAVRLIATDASRVSIEDDKFSVME